MEVSDALTVIAILVTAWTIFYEVEKTRKLSRKTTAITLLHEQSMNKQWMQSLAVITKLKLDHGDYNWKQLAKNKFTIGQPLKEEYEEISYAVRDVLNYFEFLSIAILTHSANEEIVRDCMGGLMKLIYAEVKDYIIETRNMANDPEVYANYEKIVEQWKKKPNYSKPVA